MVEENEKSGWSGGEWELTRRDTRDRDRSLGYTGTYICKT